MEGLSFELPRLSPILDKEMRRKLLGDVPTLEDLADLLFGSPKVEKEEEEEEGEHLG